MKNQDRIAFLLLIIAMVLMLATIYMALVYAPIPGEAKDDDEGTSDGGDGNETESENTSGLYAPKAQKIFYFHLPSAIMSYVAFTFVFVSSIIFLYNNSYKADVVASSAAEIGFLFCTLALVTGALWGKAEWDAYWRWEDIRLVTFLILWLIFAAYLGLRSSIDEPEKRGRLSAVFGIIGFVGVPLSYFSMYIWQTLHPIVVSPGGGGLGAEMGQTLGVSFLAFIFLFIYVLIKRVNIEMLEQQVEQIKEHIEGVEYD